MMCTESRNSLVSCVAPVYNNTKLCRIVVLYKCVIIPSDISLLNQYFVFRILKCENTLDISVLFCPRIVNSYGLLKVIPQQAEVVQGVPGRLRLRIFLTFGTTRVVARQPYALAAFTPGEIPGTHFQKLSRLLYMTHGSVAESYGKNHQWQHRESIPAPSD